MKNMGSNNKPSVKLEFSKKINDYFFVVIASVPNSKKKNLIIKTAYRKKINKKEL